MSVDISASRRAPTERQYVILRMLGSGAVLLTGRKREIDPLLRRGWVTADRGYTWVRITPAGLHALGDAAEKYGWPEILSGHRCREVCLECGRAWQPKCRCGSRQHRTESEEVHRAAA